MDADAVVRCANCGEEIRHDRDYGAHAECMAVANEANRAKLEEARDSMRSGGAEDAYLIGNGSSSKPRYRPEFCRQAKHMSSLGATEYDLAYHFEVSVETIYNWILRYPNFNRAVKDGRENAKEMQVLRMEGALYHRGIGYSHNETVVKVVEGSIVKVPTVKHYPPDPTAALAFLRNKAKGWEKGMDAGASRGVITDESSKLDKLASVLLAKLAPPTEILPDVIDITPAKEPGSDGNEA